MTSQFSLGEMEVFPDLNLLKNDLQEVHIEPKTMDLLCLLATKSAQVISREEIINELWGHAHGADESLTRAVYRLRKSIQDTGIDQRLIQTVPKKGYRLTVEPHFAQPSPEKRDIQTSNKAIKKPLLPAISGIVAVLVVFVTGWYWLSDSTEQQELQVLAVLPFANLTKTSDSDFLADGMSEELIDRLTTIKGLMVLSRTSSFSLKHSRLNATEIGEKLGASYLIEGGVRRASDRLLTTVRLINAADGTQLWSRSFEHQDKDIISIQKDISNYVQQALNKELGLSTHHADLEYSSNVVAYEKYLRAKSLHRIGGKQNILKATALYRESTQLDPQYAKAWIGLSEVLRFSDFWAPESHKAYQAEYQNAIQQALLLSPNQPEFYLALAGQQENSRQWQAASLTYKKAAQIYERTHGVGSSFCKLMNLDFVAGRMKQAYVPCLDNLKREDPLSIGTSSWIQIMLHTIKGGQKELVEQEYQRSKELVGESGGIEYLKLTRIWPNSDWQTRKQQMRLAIDELPEQIPVLEEVYNEINDSEKVISHLSAALTAEQNQTPIRMASIANYLSLYGQHELAAKAIYRHFVEIGGTWFHLLWSPEHAGARQTTPFKQTIQWLELDKYWRSSDDWSVYCRPVDKNDFECH